MRDVAESDWKLFKKMLPQWQERYMEKLIGQYVEILNGDSEASSRFWALEERLNRDKLSSGVIANDIRRSTMHREIANLLIDSVITPLTTLTVLPRTLRAMRNTGLASKSTERQTSPVKRGKRRAT